MIHQHLRDARPGMLNDLEDSFGIDFDQACVALDVMAHCFTHTFLASHNRRELGPFVHAILGHNTELSMQLRSRLMLLTFRGMEGHVDLPLLARTSLSQHVVQLGFDVLREAYADEQGTLEAEYIHGQLANW